VDGVDFLVADEWSHQHLRLAVEAACVALWSWNVDDNTFRMDPRGFELWGLAPAASIEFEELSASIHPADRDRVRAAFIATRSVEGFQTFASFLLTPSSDRSRGQKKEGLAYPEAIAA
jgi:PAS domain-containing protein